MTVEQPGLAACGLCGDMTSVRSRPTRWTPEAAKEQGKKGVYDVVDRCNDAQACRARVEGVMGETWPLDDRTVPTRPADTPPDPMPAPVAPSPVASEEDIEWLR